MLSNVLPESNIPGVTVALWDFSSLMHNCSAKKEQELFWNKTQHKKYKSGSTALWETCRRVQEEGKHTSILSRRSKAQGVVEPQVVVFHMLICVILFWAPFGLLLCTVGGGGPCWTRNLGAVVSQEPFLAVLGDATSPLYLVSTTATASSVRFT